ncbi:uncharacterized protein LOC141901644 isoform X2 [Tubulanus polymorphus]|uniref:uncharacterized protein LOC141901644 isoform X2 n=1 Tax=Tubulanus polymorphus TaxID=672921 RepID=UPI003DA4B93A
MVATMVGKVGHNVVRNMGGWSRSRVPGPILDLLGMEIFPHRQTHAFRMNERLEAVAKGTDTTSGNGTLNMSNDDFILNQYLSDNKYPEHAIAANLQLYLPPFILTIGTLGNLFTSIIMQKLTHCVSSTCLYLTVLPIIETLWLYVRCGDTWLNNIADMQLSNQLLLLSDAMCKIYPFTFNFIIHFVHWLMVAACIEGFIIIRYPKKSQIMCTFERARAVILLLTVLLVCVNAQFFWTYELVTLDGRDDKPKGTLCTFASKGASQIFQDIIWPVIDTLTSEILPMIIVSVFVAMMLITHFVRHGSGPSREEEKMYKYMLDPEAFCDLRISYMAIGVFYIVLIIPQFAFRVFDYICENQKAYVDSFKLDAQSLLAEAVTEFLMFCFLGCKFFIYVITCRRFRMEFLKIMCHCFIKKKIKTDTSINFTDEMVHHPLMNDRDRCSSNQVQLDYGRVTEV